MIVFDDWKLVKQWLDVLDEIDHIASRGGEKYREYELQGLAREMNNLDRTVKAAIDERIETLNEIASQMSTHDLLFVKDVLRVYLHESRLEE